MKVYGLQETKYDDCMVSSECKSPGCLPEGYLYSDIATQSSREKGFKTKFENE